jgi:hypothetical protein
MPVNADKPQLWKEDVARSIDQYNQWFLQFAPITYRTTRVKTTEDVEQALALTANLTDIRPAALRAAPQVLPILRMATAPPIARDRLIGLANVSGSLVRSMELDKQIPRRIAAALVDQDLVRIGALIQQIADTDICPWLTEQRLPTDIEVYRAATVIADRLCGAAADPIIRNEQERRQLASIQQWLEQRNYSLYATGKTIRLTDLPPSTFAFRLNVPIQQLGGTKSINIPVDCVIMPHQAQPGDLPILIEAKSAGDFTNTNKRRKEEATKMVQLRSTYGSNIQFLLFLCGYFDAGYLGYEAAEGIDWVWEHRIDDLAAFGI